MWTLLGCDLYLSADLIGDITVLIYLAYCGNNLSHHSFCFIYIPQQTFSFHQQFMNQTTNFGTFLACKLRRSQHEVWKVLDMVEKSLQQLARQKITIKFQSSLF